MHSRLLREAYYRTDRLVIALPICYFLQTTDPTSRFYGPRSNSDISVIKEQNSSKLTSFVIYIFFLSFIICSFTETSFSDNNVHKYSHFEVQQSRVFSQTEGQNKFKQTGMAMSSFDNRRFSNIFVHLKLNINLYKHSAGIVEVPLYSSIRVEQNC